MNKRVTVFIVIIAALTLLAETVVRYEVDTERCIGCRMCVPTCPIGAISIVRGKAVIDPEKCIGSGECIKVCPVKAISPVFREIEPETPLKPISEENETAPAPEPAAIDTRGIVETTVVARGIHREKIEAHGDSTEPPEPAVLIPILDVKKCISCGICAIVCPEGAIEIVDGKPVIDPEKCVGSGECVKRCPVKALSFPEGK